MSNEFYGDKFRWFIGIVEDNRDPMQLGRVRVRIYGVHSEDTNDIATSDLPWSQVALPPDQPGISGLSETIQLQPGAKVYGFFFDGAASQLPIVTGIIPQIEYSDRFGDLDRVDPLGTPPGHGTTGERNSIQPEDIEALGGAGSAHAEIAFNFFLSQGFTPEQAAGIVGNLMQESGPGLNTSIKAAGSEESYGIAQWNSAAAAGNRFGQLQEFAKDLGRDWTELEVQLRFIMYELEKYPYLGLAPLRAAKTVEDATIVFETKYERPSTPHRSQRIAYAKDVLKRYS